MFAKSLVSFILLMTLSSALAQDAPLELNKPIKRELNGGQSHSYSLTLGAQQFVNLAAEQQGINIVVVVLAPDQKQVLKANSSSGVRGQEYVSFVAETTGNYQLVIQSPDANAKAGAYELTLFAIRPATAAENAIATGYKTYLNSMELAAQKKIPEAIAAQEQAVAQLEQQFSKDSSALNTMPTNVISWYAGLARIVGNRAQRKSDYATAESLYQRALTMLEARFGKDSPETILTVNDMGIVAFEKSEYTAAITTMQRVLTIQQKSFPAESPGIAATSANLGAFYYRAGDYLQSEKFHRQALAIWTKLGSKSVLGARGGLALLHFERGDYEQAEKLWLDALAEIEADPKPNAEMRSSFAIMLGNLGSLYVKKDDLEKAETYWLRALTKRKEVFAPEHVEVAVALNRLGDVYLRKGDLVKAEQHFSQGLEMLKKTVGEEHENVAYSLNGLGQIAYKKREYAKAITLLQNSVNMRLRITGDNHPYIPETLGSLASLHLETGDSKQALSFQSQANEINEANLRLNLSVGSERQKQAYLSLFTKSLNATLGLQAWGLSDNQDAAKVALTAVLRNKGRGLDAMSDTFATFRLNADSEQQKLFDQLQASRSQLANLTFRGTGTEKPELYRAQLKKLETEIDTLEAELSRRSAAFSSDAQPITLATIQSALPAKTSLIEFAAYQPYQFSAKAAAPTHYVAYVMNADGTIRWKELGEAAAIDQAVTTLREALRDPGRSDVRQLARRLDEKLMQPLRPLFADSAQLLISPDGLLNLLPFAALVDEQNRYLVERYSIHYLTSGRDLLRLQVARNQKTEPVIVADPDFNLGTKINPMALAKRGTRGTLHGVRASRDDFRKWNADRLFETAKEAEAIKALLPQSNVLAREKATKNALQQINAPAILHIATHGFFLGETSSNPSANAMQINDPLLRSGLIFAGFNQHRNEGDNGVLTAKEAAGLNLWGTKLVVLSACDTGVGEVKNGEGVYGLRRALVLAGAQTQVMSLWSVDDTATREWMTAYYTGLQQGLSRSEALRQVQLKMLQKKSRQHPVYWAGFIQSGEWGNLENKR